MANSCNSYGWSGGFAALFAAISWYIVQDKRCTINLAQLLTDKFNQDHLQIFHYIAIIVGIVLFVLSFFDFAGILYEVQLVFLAAALGIFAAGAMMIYATYMDFYLACDSTIGFLTQKNVIDGNDQYGIAVMVLDMMAALLLISAAISFSRTY